MQFESNLVRLESGNGYRSILTDVTESKRVRETLQESEERFHTMADNISQLAWMAEADGSRFWFNRQLVELYWYHDGRGQGLGLDESASSR